MQQPYFLTANILVTAILLVKYWNLKLPSDIEVIVLGSSLDAIRTELRANVNMLRITEQETSDMATLKKIEYEIALTEKFYAEAELDIAKFNKKYGRRYTAIRSKNEEK